MRFNTINKRKKVKSIVVQCLINEGYHMYAGQADKIVETWIQHGLAGITSEAVKESLRYAMRHCEFSKQKYFLY